MRRRDRDRRDRGDHAAVRGRKRPEHCADRVPGEQHRLALAHALGIADRQRGQARARNPQQREIVRRIVGAARRRSQLRLARRSRNEDGATPSPIVDVQQLRQHVRIGDDRRAVADREAGAEEAERRGARLLERCRRRPPRLSRARSSRGPVPARPGRPGGWSPGRAHREQGRCASARRSRKPATSAATGCRRGAARAR